MPRWARFGPPACMVALAVAVVVFARGWIGGYNLLDGVGVVMWVELTLDRYRDLGGVGAWFGELWSGTPVWALVPSTHLLWLLPLAAFIGPDQAVIVASIGSQVAAAIGAFVLVRSIIGGVWPPLLAGLVYGLHPMLVAHLTVFGHEPAGWVIAALPWFAWTLHGALRGKQPAYIGAAALIGAFGVVQQAENAYALVLVGGVLGALELARALQPGGGGAAPVVVRAGTVMVLVAGLCAFWLVPFAAMSRHFVLTPPEDVLHSLTMGFAAELGAAPQQFVQRAAERAGTVYMDPIDVMQPGHFYLGIVPLVLTAVAVALIPVRDRDGSVTAVLLAGAIGLWLSIGAVPLARSELADAGSVIIFVIVGGLVGVLVASFLVHCGLGRWRTVIAVPAAVASAAVPYVAPAGFVGTIVPFMDAVRFPKFYPLAALAVAVGSAVTMAVVVEQLKRLAEPEASRAAAAATVLVAAVLLVDFGVYRSMYRLTPDLAYRAGFEEAAEQLRAHPDAARVAVRNFGDPLAVRPFLQAGIPVTTGWPHPIAASGMYAMSGSVWRMPGDYALHASALAGATHIVGYTGLPRDGPEEGEVVTRENPFALPVVRAYSTVAVVSEADATPELAMVLAQRGIGVVAGTDAERTMLGGLTASGPAPTDDEAPAVSWEQILAGEAATARHLSTWSSSLVRPTARFDGQGRAGAVFEATDPNLSGVSVALVGDPHTAGMTLHELGADSRTLGRVVASGFFSHVDDRGFHHFAFDTDEILPPGRYAFVLGCPECPQRPTPRVVASEDVLRQGDLVVDGAVNPRWRVAFYPVYQTAPEVELPRAAFRHRWTRSGEWEIEVSLAQPALVVVAESHFPGWRVEVDRGIAEPLRADGGLLGVALGGGDHTLRLRYTGIPGTGTGRAISVVALLATTILILAGAARAVPRGGAGAATRR